MGQLLAEHVAGSAAEPSDLAEASTMPCVRRIGPMQPFTWLRLGARDLARSLAPSLALGLLVAALGLFLGGVGWKASYMAPALLGGFLLVAPVLAILLYGLTRQLEQGGAASLAGSWRAWRANAGSILLFGLVLCLAYIVWERLAAIVFALFYEGEPLRLANWPVELLSGRNSELLAAFVLVGAALAAIVFALGVITAPLLLDRPVDVITAMLTSLRCCRLNPVPLLLWALLIAGLGALGFATLMLGLTLIFPWLAHASWHAYRDLIED